MTNSSLPLLAIDIGGSHTRLGLFTTLDVLDFTPLASFPTRADYTEELDAIKKVAREHDLHNLGGAGVSVAARVARDGRRIIFGPNLPSYLKQPLADDLEKFLGCPVRLAHDTVCG